MSLPTSTWIPGEILRDRHILDLPADTSVECDEPNDPEHTGFATATDACDPATTIGYFDETTARACSQQYTITRTWTAADGCGNETAGAQTIAVVDLEEEAVVWALTGRWRMQHEPALLPSGMRRTGRNHEIFSTKAQRHKGKLKEEKNDKTDEL